MLATILSGALVGIDGLLVEVEVDTAFGLPQFTTVGLPEGAEIVAYCHSGSRSATAVSVLRAAGYEARNYGGSWHEWSADPALPVES